MYIGLHVKYPSFLSYFTKKNSNFLDRLPKNDQILNFFIIRPIGAELFYAGGWTDKQT
jgi:hypothetical protein